MKKLILIIILLLPLASYSQALLWYTEAQIRHEKSGKTFKSGTAVSGIKYISYYTSDLCWSYYFNDEGKCYFATVMPLHQNGHLEIIEILNKGAVIISDTEWKTYNEGSVLSVHLVYTKDDYYYFMYK